MQLMSAVAWHTMATLPCNMLGVALHPMLSSYVTLLVTTTDGSEHAVIVQAGGPHCIDATQHQC